MAGGLGGDTFGDGFGDGGPIAVVRARAVASHVVRVVYNREPVHRSPAGARDALNPANYRFVAVTGSAGPITPVGSSKAMVVGPAAGVLTGEFGIDIHTDRALVIGLTYQVTVMLVKARAGEELGTPYAAQFVGISELGDVLVPRREPRFFDWTNSLDQGVWPIDDSGDIQPQELMGSLQKRILRRATTKKGAFRALPNYGAGLRLKDPMEPARLQSAKLELVSQLKLEPEIEDVTCGFVVNPLGLLEVSLSVQLRRGFPLRVKMTGDGIVVE